MVRTGPPPARAFYPHCSTDKSSRDAVHSPCLHSPSTSPLPLVSARCLAVIHSPPPLLPAHPAQPFPPPLPHQVRETHEPGPTGQRALMLLPRASLLWQQGLPIPAAFAAKSWCAMHAGRLFWSICDPTT
eukprot:scaffold3866_cov89-Isochrysis_galbana.AAC.1